MGSASASRSRRKPRRGSTLTRSAPSRARSTLRPHPQGYVHLGGQDEPHRRRPPEFLHFIKKYKRFESKEGDILTIGQCRPLSKTVRFNVVKVEKNQIFGPGSSSASSEPRIHRLWRFSREVSR